MRNQKQGNPMMVSLKKSWALIKKTVQRHDDQSLYSVYMLRILISLQKPTK